MTEMGELAKLFRHSKSSRNQVDKCRVRSVPLKTQLVDAEARLARLKELPLSAFAEKSHKAWKAGFNGQLITSSVDNKDDAIARAKADVAELRVRLSQRLSKTVNQTEGGQNALSSPPNNKGEV
jgi:hypothetical protein